MDGCKRPGRMSPTRIASPGRQLPHPALDAVRGATAAWERPVARDGHARARRRRACAAAGHRVLVRTVGAGGTGDRQRHGHINTGTGAAEPHPGRGRGGGVPAGTGTAAQARWTAKASPTCRLVRGDGVDVLDALFGPDSLTGVRVFFPDPWPKARHHKRRLLQPATVALIADRLRPGGVLHAANRSRRVRRADRRSRRRRTAACAASQHRTRCRSRCSGPSRNTKAKPSTRAAPLPNCSGRKP